MKYNNFVLLVLLSTLVSGTDVLNDEMSNYKSSASEEAFSNSDVHKREAKYVNNLDKILEDLKEGKVIEKRKYVDDLNKKLESSDVLEKRKYIDDLIQKIEASDSNDEGVAKKRSPKYVSNLEDFRKLLDGHIYDNSNRKRETKHNTKYDDLLWKLKHIAKAQSNERDDDHPPDISKHFDMSSDSKDTEAYFNVADEQKIFGIDGTITNNVIASYLPQMSSISIFAGYIRDNMALANKTSEENTEMLIIAPSNNAISTKLYGLKPWEFPNTLNGADDDERKAEENIKKFLEAHIALDIESSFSVSSNIVAFLMMNKNKVFIKKIAVDNFEISKDGDYWYPAQHFNQYKNGYVFVIDEVLVAPAETV